MNLPTTNGQHVSGDNRGGRTFTAGQAWDNLNNGHARSRWADAASRLRSGVVLAEASPRFAIDPRDKVFCVGSCFAKNIEKQLLQSGLDVLSRQIPLVSGKSWLSALPNVFNPFSILNEFRWALDPGCVFPEQALITDAAGSYFDPHSDPNLLQCSHETALNRRRAITECFRNAAHCRVVIVTLGLAEAWFDERTGLYLNTALPRQLMQREPERFSLHVLSHSACVSALQQVYELLARFGHSDFQLVVTVSPVPLKATFTGRDVLVANAASKATLRCAVEEFVGTYTNVHYLPTYENVLHSDCAAAWEDDLRHVTDRVVRLNMLHFVAQFVSHSSTASEAHAALADLGQAAFPVAAQAHPGRELVPDFWSAEAGSLDFPAGFPRIESSSNMSPEFDAGALMSGPRRIWHAQRPPRFPEWLTFDFCEPFCCRTLWLRAQEIDRTPVSFALEASTEGGSWHTLLRIGEAGWDKDHAWKSWPVHNDQAWSVYRLLIHATGGHPDLLTLRKVWLSPHPNVLAAGQTQPAVELVTTHTNRPDGAESTHVIELDVSSPAAQLLPVPAALAQGKVVVLRRLQAIHDFRERLVEMAIGARASAGLRDEIVAFYDRAQPLSIDAIEALSGAIKVVCRDHLLSQYLAPVVAAMGFPAPVLLDGGISRLVLPRELVEQAQKSGRFEPTDFKRQRADGPVEIFMPGQANIHRDFNREHYLLQCNLWFPLHDAGENEVLRLYPHLYGEPVFDMDANAASFTRLGEPAKYRLHFGDAVLFHGENLHTSPAHAQANYRRHSYDFRIAAHCSDDNAHYRYNFLNLANFLPGPRREAAAIDGINALRQSGPFSRPDPLDIFQTFKALPFAEDRWLEVAHHTASWSRETALAAATECADRSEYYFWVLRAGEMLVSLGNERGARQAFERGRALAQATGSLADYMPVSYSNSRRQLLPCDAVVRADELLAKLTSG